MTKTLNIGIKLLHPDAKTPTKANPTDSCYDVVAVEREELVYPVINRESGAYYGNKIYGYKYHLGFALNLPPDTELQVRSRSSIFKTGLILSNGIGTGDEGYTGEYSVVFYHVVPELPPYKVGDRVAQIQCVSRSNMSFNLVEELPEKDRGEQGFGSSDTKTNFYLGDKEETKDLSELERYEC